MCKKKKKKSGFSWFETHFLTWKYEDKSTTTKSSIFITAFCDFRDAFTHAQHSSKRSTADGAVCVGTAVELTAALRTRTTAAESKHDPTVPVLRLTEASLHLSEHQRTDPDSAGSPFSETSCQAAGPPTQQWCQRRLQVFKPQQLVNHSTVFFMLFWLETACDFGATVAGVFSQQRLPFCQGLMMSWLCFHSSVLGGSTSATVQYFRL